VAVPVAHEIAPVWQGPGGLQAPPAVHATQAPLLQTSLVPHEVPLVTLPVATQTGVPLEQEVVPV
jgi:hypothetical protein